VNQALTVSLGGWKRTLYH